MNEQKTRHYSSETFRLLLAGQLTSEEMDAIEQHVQTCPSCANRLELASVAEDVFIDRLRPLAPTNGGPLNFVITVIDQQGLAIQCELVRALEIGRQFEHEPLLPSFQSGTDMDRLRIAPLTFRYMSRKHLLVTPISKSTVHIQSLTTKGIILINKRQQILPGESREAEVPVDLWLGKYVVKIRRGQRS